MNTQYVLQGRVWKSYGLNFMASLYFQLSLYSVNSSPIFSSPNFANYTSSDSESTHISLSELACLYKQTGHFQHFSRLSSHLSEKMKVNLRVAKHWIVLNNDLNCMHAIWQRNSKLLKSYAANLKSRFVHLGEMYEHIGKYVLRNSTAAFQDLSALLEKTSFPDVKIKIHTFLADIFFDSSQYGRAISSHLLPALELSNSLFMEKQKSEIRSRIAACYFLMGDAQKCWDILEEVLAFTVVESGIVTRCAILRWCCKCRLRILCENQAKFTEMQKQQHLYMIQNIITRMESEISDSLRDEFGILWKEVLFIKALVLNLQGRKQDSFDVAKQFNVLDKETQSSWPKFVL